MTKILNYSELINPGLLKRILIINFGGIGDLLISTSALRALKTSYPNSQICLLVAWRVYEVVRDLPYIDAVFIFYMQTLHFLKDIKTLFTLRRQHFDLTINMRTLVSKRSAAKIKFLLDVINPKLKAGRDTEGRGSFFDIKISEADIGEKYEMDYDIETVKALGAEVIERDVDFKIDEGSFKRIRQTLENEGISKDDIILGIHLGGKPSHRWPIDYFLKALKEINERVKCKFVVTGERQDSYTINRILRKSDLKIISMAGKLNIKELGALIRMCSIYITNDTGPMHIAAALKTPMVAIFGPGFLTRYNPGNISDRVVVLHKKVDCSPCNKVICKSMQCLKVILPQEVVNAVLTLLESNTK